MAVSSFKDISFGDEPISTDKLNTLAANARYLFERAPKLYFNAYSVQKDSGIKIAAGVATIPPNKNAYQYVNVNFGSFFTPGCRPIITTGIVSPFNGRIIPTMFGFTGPGNVPDNRGFVCRLAMAEFQNVKQNYFIKTMYLHWIAIGY